MAGRAYSPRFLWMWPASRAPVMAVRQAASVLAAIRREQAESAGATWTDERIILPRPDHEQYELWKPVLPTARLWDDGIIDPG
jgi:3-methylcrotonyl-CoA carboxylase beta subunit